mmetsp:Transcript_74924/g.223255  ORF Transcript_74924/g.223255 Transcript_74924/m.223255 type:complete len:198 (+) Transcript_74924:60-653(+)
MVRVVCPACSFEWNARPAFDWKECVKCSFALPADARRTCVARPPIEQRKAKMKERFTKMDLSEDGRLDFDEMAGLLRKGNPGMSDIELWTLYHQIDKDSDGKISFDEFYDYLYRPSSAGRGQLSPSVRCRVNAGAPHEFKFGRCSFCGVAQGTVEPQQGTLMRKSSYELSKMCPEGNGKCSFKFARCTKCGRSELAP